MARKIILKQDGLSGSIQAPSGYKYIGYSGATFSEKLGATISSIGGGSLGLSGVLSQDNIMLDTQNILSEDGKGELKMGWDFGGGFESYLYRTGTESRVGLYTDQKGIVLCDTSTNSDDRVTVYSNNGIWMKNGNAIFPPLNNDSITIENADGGVNIISATSFSISSDSSIAGVYYNHASEILTIENNSPGYIQILSTTTVVMNDLPSYVDDAAADADTNLPSGGLYKLNSGRQVFQKP